MSFTDRRDAGRRLATRLEKLAARDPVVLALPRGGVPVAAEVATTLEAPMDVLVVRKLGHPHQPELGLGAIGEGGVRILNEALLATTGVTAAEIAAVEERETAVLECRLESYRGHLPPLPVAGRTVILIDDGIATGSTARTAIEVLRRRGAAEVVLAVPVAAAAACEELREVADVVVCLEVPVQLRSIGQWYTDFSQVDDDEVTKLLADSRP